MSRIGNECVAEPARASPVRSSSCTLSICFPQVDEEGATAAAASAMIAARMCCVRPDIQVRADHPFVVALVYDNKIPVFLGHVTNPEAN